MSFVLIRIIFTQKKINKVALSGADDKRIILEECSLFLAKDFKNEIGVFHFFFVRTYISLPA